MPGIAWIDPGLLPLVTQVAPGSVPATGTPVGKYLRDDLTWAQPPAGSAPEGTGYVHVTDGVLDTPVATATPSSHSSTAHSDSYDAAGAASAAQAASLPLHAKADVAGAADTAVALAAGTDRTKLDTIASGAEVNVNADWNAGSGDAQILNKPTLLALGETAATAHAGDKGKTAYDHSQGAHAPAGAQANADITKAEIEAKLTGAIATHSHSGGADPFMAKLVLAADKPTGANVTPVTLGLSFNYEANSKYVIDFFMLVAPTAATTGCGFLIDVSSVVTYVATFASHQLAITGTITGGGSIGDLGATSQGVSSGMVGTGINFVPGSGILITGANAGIATFFFRSETTAVTTCKAGSMIRVMKLA